MTYLATVTDKRQITIPVDVYKAMKMEKGQKLMIRVDGGIINMEPVENLVERLAGSVKVPARFKGLGVDEMITKAKREYFADKAKK